MSYVVLLIAAGVTIYALVDCINSPADEVRGLPRPAWLFLILLIPPVGGIAYLLAGRLGADEPRLSQPRVLAPDDDPDFLRQLDQQRRRAATDERRREAQLRKEREKEREKDRKDREKAERQHRKERQGDHDGEGHTEHPTG